MKIRRLPLAAGLLISVLVGGCKQPRPDFVEADTPRRLISIEVLPGGGIAGG